MYNKRKQIYHSKGKNQVLSRLMHGEFLGNLFALTVNGEEVYYKGSWPSISANYDQIIYIPDVFVSEIPVYRSARLDEYEWLKANLYTADDFLHFANNDPVRAQAILQSMTGQNPILNN